MEQRELARLSGVTPRTIAWIEGLSSPVAGTFQTVQRIKKVLESRGIVFTEDGVRLRKPGTEPSDRDHPT
jgi:transcriptional regulator with XRE-family HTH domain